MMRKPTKNTRGVSSEEKVFQGWVKYQPCIWCGCESGSIVDHVKGSTFKHEKVLIGHWFVLPNCQSCDYKKTVEGQRLGDYSGAWSKLIKAYPGSGRIPINVEAAICSWGMSWQNVRL